MTIHNQFVPGNWEHDIDVNDFINLNEKPFFQAPIFLTPPTERIQKLYHQILTQNEKPFVLLEESSIKNVKKEEYVNVDVEKVNLFRGFGRSESEEEIKKAYAYKVKEGEKGEREKTVTEWIGDINSVEIKKMIKIGLFEQTPTTYTPSYVFPDIRQVALYGTKKIIEEKRYYLKTIENHLQTPEWLEKRIEIIRQIESLKEFVRVGRQCGLDITKPAETTKEVLDFLYLALLCIVKENPSVTVSLSSIVSFVDVFIEYEMTEKKRKEEEIQEDIDLFYLRIQTLPFVTTPGFLSFYDGNVTVMGDTFGKTITKTTYRLLRSIKEFSNLPFCIRIVWNPYLPEAFQTFCEELLQQNVPLHIINERVFGKRKKRELHAHGILNRSDEEVTFFGGVIDMERVLFLGFNGGKDVKTNTNVMQAVNTLAKGTVTGEDMMKNWEECMVYVITTYIEMVRSVMYLHEKSGYHPLRNAFLLPRCYYNVQIGLAHMDSFLSLLCAIKNHTYELKRDKKGNIYDMIVTEKINREEKEMMCIHVVDFIQKEIQKLRIYKHGEAHLHIYPKGYQDFVSTEEIGDMWTVPPELAPSCITMNCMDENITFSWINRMFRDGVHELNLATSDDSYFVDGVLVQKK